MRPLRTSKQGRQKDRQGCTLGVAAGATTHHVHPCRSMETGTLNLQASALTSAEDAAAVEAPAAPFALLFAFAFFLGFLVAATGAAFATTFFLAVFFEAAFAAVAPRLFLPRK